MPLPISMITSRRQTLGLALLSLAGLSQATTAEGKNRKNRKKKDKCDRKIERAIADRCSLQVDFCLTNISPICELAADGPACETTVRQCWDFISECDLPAYVACAQANFPSPESP